MEGRGVREGWGREPWQERRLQGQPPAWVDDWAPFQDLLAGGHTLSTARTEPQEEAARESQARAAWQSEALLRGSPHRGKVQGWGSPRASFRPTYPFLFSLLYPTFSTHTTLFVSVPSLLSSPHHILFNLRSTFLQFCLCPFFRGSQSHLCIRNTSGSFKKS